MTENRFDEMFGDAGTTRMERTYMPHSKPL